MAADDKVQLEILNALKGLSEAVVALKAQVANPRGMVEDKNAAHKAAKRAKAKAAAKVEGGLSHYIVRGEAFYRLGTTYPPGSVVAIPKDEDPAHMWEPVLVEGAKAPADAVLPKATVRAADRT